MPASICYYRAKDTTTLDVDFISSDLDNSFGKTLQNLYDVDGNLIGTENVLLQGVKFASDDVIVTYTSFNRFNELSGFPNGDDNILSLTTTFVNKLNTDDGSLPVLKEDNLLMLKEETYTLNYNPMSTGEYANQVCYAQFTRDNAEQYDKIIVNFPQPIVTYTNAFNSLPQINTAPLPA